ncbi:MAG TPA: helix-turn-helix domain-containing protein [Pseudomonadales bacterium]
MNRSGSGAGRSAGAEGGDPRPRRGRVGRPRAAGPSSGDPREEILAAARRLFRQKGFAATSTREIARLAGLRQPSLFHHFPNKEALLREVAVGAVQPVLAFVAAEARERRPADVALYRLIRFDTWHLCTNPNALGSPFNLPEMTREQLPEFWTLRDRLAGEYERLLRRGRRERLFVLEDVRMTSRMLFALGESVLEVDPDERQRRAAKLAAATANLALRAVLADPSRLASVRREAGR